MDGFLVQKRTLKEKGIVSDAYAVKSTEKFGLNFLKKFGWKE